MTDGPAPIVSAAVTYTRRGGYEVIAIAERTVRPPAADEVRIAVKAAAVSVTDLLLRDPAPGIETWPVVPGLDAAGVVEAVGPGVSRLRVGQEVMCAVLARRPEGGAQARHVVVPAASAVPIPRGATLAEASTLPMNGLTALLALETAALGEGQVLAVSGGAGLLAHYTIALASRRGLRVIADAKPAEIELVRGYGASEVVERSDDFAAALRRVVPHGVDALLDTAVLNRKAFGAIRNGGTYIPVRGWKDEPGERDIAIRPVFVYDAFQRTDWLEHLRAAAEVGDLRLRVAGEYAIDQVAAAQRSLEAGGVRGRPVIVF